MLGLFVGLLLVLGVFDINIKVIEISYLGLLKELDWYFKVMSFLMGMCFCIGDFGFIGLFYVYFYCDFYFGCLM